VPATWTVDPCGEPCAQAPKTKISSETSSFKLVRMYFIQLNPYMEQMALMRSPYLLALRQFTTAQPAAG
jgi:hypothetical protein